MVSGMGKERTPRDFYYPFRDNARLTGGTQKLWLDRHLLVRRHVGRQFRRCCNLNVINRTEILHYAGLRFIRYIRRIGVFWMQHYCSGCGQQCDLSMEYTRRA